MDGRRRWGYSWGSRGKDLPGNCCFFVSLENHLFVLRWLWIIHDNPFMCFFWQKPRCFSWFFAWGIDIDDAKYTTLAWSMVSFYHIMPEGGSNPLSWRLITVPNTSIWTGARFNFGGALANVRSKSYSWEFRRRDAHTQARLGEKLFKTSEPHNSAYLLHTSPILLIISNLRLKNSLPPDSTLPEHVPTKMEVVVMGLLWWL